MPDINPELAEDQRKEEFDIGISDADLITQINAWMRESDSLYETLQPVWEQNLEYYKGNQTSVALIRGKFSKAVENRIWMAVETMIPIATSRLPDIVVKSDEEDEKAQLDALALQDVLAYHMERVQIQAQAERFLRDMIVKRYGVFKPFWDKEGDDVGVTVVDPRRIRLPKYGKTVDDLAFIIEELEISYSQASSFFGEEKAKELLESSEPDSEHKKRKATFTVLEVWTNAFVAWRVGSEILRKEKNPYWKKDSFFPLPKKPYVIKSLFETEESIIGETDYVQQAIPIQDNLNIRKRQIEDITNHVADPILGVDSDVMSEEEANNITNEPGFILYGKDAANEAKVRFHSPGQVPQYLFTDLELSRKEFDNIWGIHSTTRGEREGKETLGGRQLLREADLGRIDLIARQLERALDEIAEYWTQLIKMFYTEEKTFSILGDDGIRFVKSFTGKQVRKVKPMVKPGSTLKEDEYAIQQKAILLWQNKAIGIKTLYKMLRIPNPQEAMQDFIETQSGQLLQVGGAAPGATV